MHWKNLALLAGLCSAVALGQDESVYAPPTPVGPDEGTNEGGVSLELDVRYLTDYLYRGVDYTRTDRSDNEEMDMNISAMMRFDLGERMPHPFVGTTANVYDSDPESRFQEFRPSVGADLTLQPVKFTAALQSYTYPQREDLETSEALFKVQLDDSRMLGADRPLLQPYVMVAYDYDLNDGFYIEGGVSHDFVIEDLSMVITPVAAIAYTRGWQQQFVFVADEGNGWQHFDVGLNAKYKLNSLLNISPRFGEWYARAQIFHSEHLAESTVGHSQTWGGLGIGFEY